VDDRHPHNRRPLRCCLHCVCVLYTATDWPSVHLGSDCDQQQLHRGHQPLKTSTMRATGAAAARGPAVIAPQSTATRLCTPRLATAAPARRSSVRRAIELDFSDPDTQVSVAGLVLGLVFGLGAPTWYIQRTERDEERLEELRAMNRANYAETGEYLSEVRVL